MGMGMFGDKKTYVMVNRVDGARIQCTEKYVTKWLAMGFEVEEILNVDNPHSSKMESEDKKNTN